MTDLRVTFVTRVARCIWKWRNKANDINEMTVAWISHPTILSQSNECFYSCAFRSTHSTTEESILWVCVPCIDFCAKDAIVLTCSMRLNAGKNELHKRHNTNSLHSTVQHRCLICPTFWNQSLNLLGRQLWWWQTGNCSAEPHLETIPEKWLIFRATKTPWNQKHPEILSISWFSASL